MKKLALILVVYLFGTTAYSENSTTLIISHKEFLKLSVEGQRLYVEALRTAALSLPLVQNKNQEPMTSTPTSRLQKFSFLFGSSAQAGSAMCVRFMQLMQSDETDFERCNNVPGIAQEIPPEIRQDPLALANYKPVLQCDPKVVGSNNVYPCLPLMVWGTLSGGQAYCVSVNPVDKKDPMAARLAHLRACAQIAKKDGLQKIDSAIAVIKNNPSNYERFRANLEHRCPKDSSDPLCQKISTTLSDAREKATLHEVAQAY